MKSFFGRLNKTLKHDFEKAIQSESNEEIFNLLREYMKFIEDENESYKYLFVIGQNPLDELKDTQKSMEKFNTKCLSFLIKTVNNSDSLHPYDSTLSEAQTFMGLGYEFGLFGLSKDDIKAVGYYSSAARQNHPIGTFRMGQCLEKGIGKPKNWKHALDFYRCSAKLGYIAGMHTYGSVLIHGDMGSKKDIQSGLFYLKLAVRKATHEYPYPYYDLAQIYESNMTSGEIQTDEEYAFRMYLKGAELSCPNCQYRVAKCYETGELMQERNLALAYNWYKKASELGQIDAQMSYSRILFTGIDGIVQSDLNESLFWALKAAIKGHPQAAYSVAEFAEAENNGTGNTLLAIWWYTVSYEFGNTQAKSKINMLQHQIDIQNRGSKEPKCCGCFCWSSTK
ncbi:TPR repeat-containing protein [Ordospora colligata]|uniref:TPR repeat-containing protein n=1 Tax=Ordospora colligata OC4 TaxID=1354746 RepID=A0A0B2UEP3_9MICR|nr:TPR repeat-containing protein [Ordospora colligata OC4]KHN69556.1 TPR repeat-containing protein [Ordospora colligata OC4]TBU15376.1 TPR repeat-containing protein [Ordospora colligata]TBU15476.1 TPR repeat-containing protein [Ordospora colligata]TBU18572.1 TPR repeat-containing protein [Ordospora colligata]